MNALGSTQFPVVGVVLVNWNGWRDTIECIDSLMGQNYPHAQIIVVDNASTDSSVEKIEDWCADPAGQGDWRQIEGVRRWTDSGESGAIRCIRVHASDDWTLHRSIFRGVLLVDAGRNGGFAAGCNVGMRVAAAFGALYFWLLNTDVVVEQQALEHLVERSASKPDVGMCGSTICFYDSPWTVQCLGGAELECGGVTSRLIGQGGELRIGDLDWRSVEHRMGYVMGASMLVSLAFVREIGLMQEDYFLYFEEIDWAMRGRARFTLGYAPRSLIYHKSGASSSKVMPLFTSQFYYRNRLRFAARFVPEKFGAAKRSLWSTAFRMLLKGKFRTAIMIAGVLSKSKVIQRDAVTDRLDYWL